jgi:hypothetical protein
VAAVLSLLLLNASLTFVNVWPTPAIAWGNALSLELAVCVLLLAIRRRRAAASRLLPALWVLLVAGHYLDVTTPGLYGREFNVYWDSQHLGAVSAMLARVAPWWLIGAVAAGALLTIAVAYVSARFAIEQVAAAMERRAARLGLGSLSGVVVLLFAVQQLGAMPSYVPFADPVTPAYARQARYALGILGSRSVPSLAAGPDLDTPMRALGGADVVLAFVESYGAVTYETPAIAGGLVESRAALAAAARETGRDVISAYVESPTFGGSSWLAHLTLLSGIDVRDQYAYTALMASGRDSIITNFSRRGYRTVALMPGMRQAWPEGAFYGFDVIYGFDALQYPGPQFGWWGIPDQYSLAKVDALERARAPRAPVFVVFPTSTSHAPFGPVPPYQPAWSRVLTDAPFDTAQVEASLADAPDLTNMRPSYVRAIAYELTTLAGYLRERDDDLVLIAIGDHQPPAAVSGPGAPWHVPVHVVGPRGSRVLDALRGRGFQPGLELRWPSVGAMHELTAMLLDAFDAPAGEDYLDAGTLKGSRVPPIARAASDPSTGGP